MLNSSLAMQWSSSQISQWQVARQKQGGQIINRAQHTRTIEVKWKAHAENRIKINVDASVIPGTQTFSIGLVARNYNGDFSVFEVEVREVLEAV